MASISIVDLFVALENHVGKEALLGAFAAYSGSSSTPQKAVTVPPVPGAPVKARKPQSEETKAAAALKRAATKAAKAIAAAGAADAVPAAAVVDAVPAVVADAPAEKPKKVLSAEQKAKMKAGREAAAAKKAAAAAAAPVAEAAAPVADAAPAPVAEDGSASDTSSQKRRGPKSKAELAAMSAEERAEYEKKAAERKAKKAAKAAAPAAAEVPLPASPAPVAAEESHTIFAPFTYKGVSYLRNKRGDLLTEEYEWVGRYNSAAKTIDTKFAKPADLEDE
jgi:hypothetical protein